MNKMHNIKIIADKIQKDGFIEAEYQGLNILYDGQWETEHDTAEDSFLSLVAMMAYAEDETGLNLSLSRLGGELDEPVLNYGDKFMIKANTVH